MRLYIINFFITKNMTAVFLRELHCVHHSVGRRSFAAVAPSAVVDVFSMFAESSVAAVFASICRYVMGTYATTSAFFAFATRFSMLA